MIPVSAPPAIRNAAQAMAKHVTTRNNVRSEYAAGLSKSRALGCSSVMRPPLVVQLFYPDIGKRTRSVPAITIPNVNRESFIPSSYSTAYAKAATAFSNLAAENHLLRLPAVGDNAAMEAETPKADPPKRKRRWFQFSLRTLMIVVTLLAIPCGYVGWQAKIVRERRAVLDRITKTGGYYHETPRPDPATGYNWHDRYEPPLIRRWLGERPIHTIELPFGFPDAELKQIDEMFPGAYVTGGLL
jgi:hypothetical protein